MYDKCVYIDSDTILRGDIGELFDTDLEGNAVAAMVDPKVDVIPEFRAYVGKAVGVPYKDYCNSGVLVMNMKALRKMKYLTALVDTINKYDADLVAPDQDYINAMLYGKIKYLDYRWNCMPTEFGLPLKDPAIIHYNLFLKPWHYKVMYDKYFWNYVNVSGYRKEIMRERKSYNRFGLKKSIDRFHLLIMIKRAKELTKENKEDNFKNVFESGREKRL